MDDAELVSGLEARSDLGEDRQGRFRGERPIAAQALTQILALEELHGEEVDLGRGAALVLSGPVVEDVEDPAH